MQSVNREGMKPGGVRELLVPPKLGWGAKGMPPAIPANATVLFEIELLKNISVDAKMKTDEGK